MEITETCVGYTRAATCASYNRSQFDGSFLRHVAGGCVCVGPTTTAACHNPLLRETMVARGSGIPRLSSLN